MLQLALVRGSCTPSTQPSSRLVTFCQPLASVLYAMIGERGKEMVLPCLDGLARIPIMRSERETMCFADGILTEDLEPLRQRLLTHPLWTGIEQGTLPRGTHIKTLLINLDNGPENHSRRTQFMQRLLEFVERYRITVRLAYYPPYLSQIPSSRTVLGDFRAALEWFLARLSRCSDPLCQHDDLKRKSSGRRIGDEHLSNRRQIDKGGHGRRRNPTSALPVLGKVVCGYQEFSASYARE